jgi:hypothetical protein
MLPGRVTPFLTRGYLHILVYPQIIASLETKKRQNRNDSVASFQR